MLRVWFGDRDNAIYNTSVFFKNQYNPSWLEDEQVRQMILDVDRSEVVSSQSISSPVLGIIPPEKLSGGVKALILMRFMPWKIFNASNCGNNCAPWILRLAEDRDFTINLHHIMDFGKSDFRIKIMNSRKVVTNMSEFLDAGVKYLRENS